MVLASKQMRAVMNDILLSMYMWFLTDRGQSLLAGIAGSLVAVMLEWKTAGANARRFFCGFVAAIYLGPAGVPFFTWVFNGINIPVESAASFGIFIMGVCGVVVLEVFTRTLRLWQGVANKGGHNDTI